MPRFNPAGHRPVADPARRKLILKISPADVRNKEHRRKHKPRGQCPPPISTAPHQQNKRPDENRAQQDSGPARQHGSGLNTSIRVKNKMQPPQVHCRKKMHRPKGRQQRANKQYGLSSVTPQKTHKAPLVRLYPLLPQTLHRQINRLLIPRNCYTKK